MSRVSPLMLQATASACTRGGILVSPPLIPRATRQSSSLGIRDTCFGFPHCFACSWPLATACSRPALARSKAAVPSCCY